MEAGQRSMPQCVTTETENNGMPICDTETCPDSEEDEQAIKKKDEVENEGELDQFPTMFSDTGSSQCEEGVDSEGEPPFCQHTADSAGPNEDNASLSGDCGPSNPERMLQESVERLKTLMETAMWRQRQTGEHFS